MKNFFVLSLVAIVTASAVGCSSCGSSCGRRSSIFSFFNRGDSCRTCGSGQVISDDGYNGSLGSPILNNVPAAPRSMGELPGPVSISPIPVN